MRRYANAKINIYLKVLRKNENGYHDLDSLMVPINLYDCLDVIESDIDEIIGMDIPLETNLIYKAIELIRKEFSIGRKVKVVIEKNIPSFAGLGGGSSDAACVIKCLNEMWKLNMSLEKMADIGSKLGSDVPFFIYNKPAIIKGRGEKITLVEVEPIQGVLIFDGLKFSTKEVFNNMKNYSEEYEDIIQVGKIKNYFDLVINDMEQGINIYKESDMIFEQKKILLENGAKRASMSGSGSSVFGLFEEARYDIIEKAYNNIKNKYQCVWKFKMI